MARRQLVLENFLPYRLSFTSNLVSEAIAAAYSALFGLSIPEWRLLAVIAEGERTTQAQIAMRTRMDKVTVSRAAATLRQRALVAIVPNPDDGRSHLLALSGEGRALYDQIAPKALELEQGIFALLDPAELEAFTRTLRKIDAAILRGERPRS